MKYATLLLGLAIALASIATARAQTIIKCGHPRAPDEAIIIEKIYVPTCPASTPKENCLSVKFDGYRISNVPIWGVDLRIKTKTPRRGVSTSGPELVAVTLEGKSCRIDD
jgi:hypothetical protein